MKFSVYNKQSTTEKKQKNNFNPQKFMVGLLCANRIFAPDVSGQTR